jgi:anti-sigma factor RsiW
VERLDVTATRALRPLLDGQPTTEAKIAFAWAIAAGPAMSRAATVSWTADGTLHVRAKSETWRLEIVRARPLLATRVAALVGPGVVQRISIAG